MNLNCPSRPSKDGLEEWSGQVKPEARGFDGPNFGPRAASLSEANVRDTVSLLGLVDTACTRRLMKERLRQHADLARLSVVAFTMSREPRSKSRV